MLETGMDVRQFAWGDLSGGGSWCGTYGKRGEEIGYFAPDLALDMELQEMA